MQISKLIRCSLLPLALLTAGLSSGEEKRMFNTVKQKLAEGKQVIGGTINTSDPNVYCSMANAGFDFTWIEMQHSPLTYDQVAKMIWACRDAPAIPFIRVPTPTEGDIQKATDIGALGIVVPMVDSVQEAEDGVTYAKFPPRGKRSQGGGQYGRLWGPNYRALANDNIMVIVMIESPAGVDIVDKVAAIDGVDVVFAASGDIGSFTGWARDDPRYMALIEKIKVETLKAGKILAGPLAWRDREGFMFFQGPSEGSLIRDGAKAVLQQPAEEMEDVATGDESN
ncbi:MAG: aldolase/citrate lyase family protein [Bryobacterales bacterium]|nr:aldolase/citrate lyase family protein [Bryobacterales bacterium]MDE0629668.1 aldolase/citrate lyase family protein [Bryobacterales bacterium]